jgi:hypothetical protein
MRARSAATNLLHSATQNVFSSGLVGAVARSFLSGQALSIGAEQAKATAGEAARWLVIVLIAFLMAATGTAMLLAAAYLVLEHRFGAVIAFAALGAGLWLFVLALLFLSQRHKSDSLLSPKEPVGQRAADAMTDGVTEVVAEMKKLSDAHPFLTIAAAFGVGLLMSLPNEQSKR